MHQIKYLNYFTVQHVKKELNKQIKHKTEIKAPQKKPEKKQELENTFTILLIWTEDFTKR